MHQTHPKNVWSARVCPARQPTRCLLHREHWRQVSGQQLIGDAAKRPQVSVRGDDVEDFCAGLGVAADAGGVAVRVEHRPVVVQVLHLDVDVGLSTQASLWDAEM